MAGFASLHTPLPLDSRHRDIDYDQGSGQSDSGLPDDLTLGSVASSFRSPIPLPNEQASRRPVQAHSGGPPHKPLALDSTEEELDAVFSDDIRHSLSGNTKHEANNGDHFSSRVNGDDLDSTVSMIPEGMNVPLNDTTQQSARPSRILISTPYHKGGGQLKGRHYPAFAMPAVMPPPSALRNTSGSSMLYDVSPANSSLVGSSASGIRKEDDTILSDLEFGLRGYSVDPDGDEDASGIYSTPDTLAADGGRKKSSRGRKSTGSMQGIDAAASNNLSLRQQEHIVAKLKKENFDLKLVKHFMEQRLASLSSEGMDAIVKENVQLQIQLAELQSSVHKHKKLLATAEKALEKLKQDNAYGSKNRRSPLETVHSNKENLEKVEREAAMYKESLENAARAQKRAREELERSEGENAQLKAELRNMQERLDESMSRRTLDDNIDRQANLEAVVAQLDESRQKVDELDYDNGQLRAKAMDLEDRLDAATQGRSSLDDDVVEDLRQQLDEAHAAAERFRQELARSATQEQKGEGVRLDEITDSIDSLFIDTSGPSGEIDVDAALSKLRDLPSGAPPGFDKIYDQLKLYLKAIKSYQSKSANNEKEIEHLEGECSRLALQREKDCNQISDEWQEEHVDSQRRIHELDRNLEQCEEALNYHKHEASNLSLDCQALATEVQQLQNGLADQESEIERLRADNAELEDEQDRLAVIIKDYQATLEETKIEHEKSMEKKLEEIASLQRQLIETRDNRHQVTGSHLEYEEQIGSLQSRLQEAIQASEMAKSTQDELQKSLRVATERSKDLQTRLHTSEQAQMRLQAMLESAQEELQETAREFDKAQDAMRSMQEDTKSSGLEDRERAVAAQIELQNARRQIAAYSSEIRGLHNELDAKDELIREKEDATRLFAEEMEDLRNVSSQQSHDLLEKIEKIKTLERDLETVRRDLSRRKTRVEELERNLQRDSSHIQMRTSDYSSQLDERNELLSRFLKAIDQALQIDGRGKALTPRPDGSSFQIFLEAAQSRIVSLQGLGKQVKERVEASERRIGEQFKTREKALNTKLNQLNDFESRIKAISEQQSQWRGKLEKRTIELQNSKSLCSQLQAEIAKSQRAQGAVRQNGDSDDLDTTPRARRVGPEMDAGHQAVLRKRLAEKESQIVQTERTWRARLLELESRVKYSEEKVHRERQGAKERVGQMSEENKKLRQQLAIAQTRSEMIAASDALNDRISHARRG